MIQSILHAHDFSPSAERALAYGADLVERTGAGMHLMSVQEQPQGPFREQKRSPAPSYKLRTQFRERCTEALRAHGLEPDDDRLSFNVERSESVAPALCRAAERRDVDLILMGTHGRRGVRRAIYGSVAEEVLRTAPCEVLITRAPEEGADETGSAPASVGRIVAPTDFSDASRDALRYVNRLASLYEVPVRLVHVVESPEMPAVYETKSPKVANRTVVERAREALEEMRSTILDTDQKVSHIVHRGEPAPTILEAAPNADDLIVMATRGLSGLRRAMLGSVTETVIRDATGPVLAARSFLDEEA